MSRQYKCSLCGDVVDDNAIDEATTDIFGEGCTGINEATDEGEDLSFVCPNCEDYVNTEDFEEIKEEEE
jgi:rubredoxin